MAFIPDDAEDRFNELSPSAERFYIYLCRTRNHTTRCCFGSIEICADKYKWSRATKFAVQKELVESGWIKKENGKWLLLVGDFSPVNKSKKSDCAKIESENLDKESKKSDSQSKKSDSHIRNIPASSTSNNQQEEIHTNTLAQTYPLKPLYEAFPDLQITPAQAGSIQVEVKSGDEAAWLATIKTYKDNYNQARNSYLPEKVGTLLKVFQKEKEDLEKKQNGKNRQYSNNNQSRETPAQRIANRSYRRAAPD